MTEKKKQLEKDIFSVINSEFTQQDYKEKEIKESISLFLEFISCKEDNDSMYQRWESLEDVFFRDLSDLLSAGSFNSSWKYTVLTIEPVLCKFFYVLKKQDFIKEEQSRLEVKPATGRPSPPMGLAAYINGLDLNPKIWIKNGKREYELPKKGHKTDPELSEQEEVVLEAIDWNEFDIDVPSKTEDLKEGLSKLVNAITSERNFIQHIIRSILVKNDMSHQAPDYNYKQKIQYLESILVTLIYITLKWKKEISQKINEVSFLKSSRIDYTDYLNKIIEKYQWSSEKYVEPFLEEHYEKDRQQNTLRSDKICKILDNLPEKKMVIWSNAGMGKTFSLVYLVYTEAKNRLNSPEDFAIPVFLELNQLIDPKKTIKDEIKEKLQIETNQLDEMLLSNQIKLYIDAINEIPTTNDTLKSQRKREIIQINQQYKDLFVIITNRPSEEGFGVFKDMPIFHLQPLDNEGIQELIQKYCTENNELNQSLIDKVNQTITNNERLKKIIQCPFLLVTTINLIKYGCEVKANQFDIIDRFIDQLLKREKQEKLDERLSVRKVKELLKYFASETFKNSGNSSVSRADAECIFNECSKKKNLQYDTDYALNTIAIPLGILRLTKENYREIISFEHEIYRDYFKAVYDDEQQ